MNLAMERLALISGIVLPITAVASIYGMNLIVQPVQLGIVLVLFHLQQRLTITAASRGQRVAIS